MLVYFLCLTYGIYLATIIDFISFTDIFLVKVPFIGEFDFYWGRQVGYIFDIDVYYEHKSRLLSGLGYREY